MSNLVIAADLPWRGPQFCRESTIMSNMSLPLQENSNLPNQRPTKGNFEKGLVDVNSEDTFLRFSR